MDMKKKEKVELKDIEGTTKEETIINIKDTEDQQSKIEKHTKRCFQKSLIQIVICKNRMKEIAIDLMSKEKIK